MSELKAMTVIDAYQLECNDNDLVYLKSEADKVISDLEESHKNEVGQLLIEIAELKNQKEYVIEYTAEVINGQERELRRHKYKRCLAMAEKCESWIRLDVSPRHTHRFIRWYKIWLDLAEKFKPNSTSQQGKEEAK